MRRAGRQRLGAGKAMDDLRDLLENNRRWATGMVARSPGFFAGLVAQQAPRYLWIGCSDSRVPANEIVGLPPGELFVHRNVANIVMHNDFSCLSVLQYAVEVLGVRHIIVCGHYGCGGVQAAWEGRQLGLVDNWLRPIRDLAQRYREALGRLPAEAQRFDRLCELNVLFQALRVCRTTIVQQAWSRGQDLTVHAWVYRLTDGLLRDLGFSVSDLEGAESEFGRVAGLGTLGA
jgi:carbonic anhydrase